MDTSKLTSTPFTYLILQLNSLLDSGKYDHITVADVHRHIDDRSVLRWIQDTAGNDIDLSILLATETYGDFDGLYANLLQNMSGGYRGSERRKWGVEKKGLCLLIAWTNEAIQQGICWIQNDDLFRTP